MAGKNKKKKKDIGGKLIAQNRKARHDYFIEDEFEVGIMLTGSEVKSLRQGQASIAESYASVEKNGELFLINAQIEPYAQAGRYNHEPRRPRKLLLHRKQLDRLASQIKIQGKTLMPLRLYFTDRGMVKLSLGLAKGKKQYDKRQTDKDRSWDRDQARLLRDRG